ncbi:hypothetical protein CLAFUW4_14211 [Fulvia fulva]|uniref:Class II hydrophobin 6 n=1 Tax=Passalora fulva TaxID=5499 RepID=HFC6_PASFU|nr:uncharacterized protein CLAFUR5_14044 [Fulvia fulva]KAK4610133.1 hypothetical protein CLAFUR4_14214 [Fulvia fulva]KAK4610840.1 hypothetical protein CLAFUR0_14219 [Fulvia fulva]UJO24336.1 hypothetical protein CLAFUR5_14044 [Fulvia fulva]WPV22078.1 hypothetical protein CLAFUW4_14211 [Fulvia fulva]WPV37297.1 hypothetical protein CLAFUW7_14222 [Fulvia fulva]
MNFMLLSAALASMAVAGPIAGTYPITYPSSNTPATYPSGNAPIWSSPIHGGNNGGNGGNGGDNNGGNGGNGGSGGGNTGGNAGNGGGNNGGNNNGGNNGGNTGGEGGNGGNGGNGGAPVELCPANRVPQCCQLSVLGVADVTCASPSSGLTSVSAFEADCANDGTTAQCCLIPVLGLGLFCSNP